jgi:transcriptional regulator with XRE-family HTH domain
MKDRIILLIKAKNLTAAQFADQIGVQKSSISHILSGRNNASLDFVQKILLSYPEVNVEWLLFGKGQLFKSNETTGNVNNDASFNTNSVAISGPVDLFSDLTPAQPHEFRKENDLISNPESESLIKNQDTKIQSGFPENDSIEKNIEKQLEKSPQQREVDTRHYNSATKSLVKIVEFYADNTFKEYFPE